MQANIHENIKNIAVIVCSYFSIAVTGWARPKTNSANLIETLLYAIEIKMKSCAILDASLSKRLLCQMHI